MNCPRCNRFMAGTWCLVHGEYEAPAPQPERRYRCRLCPMAMDNSGAFASHVRSHAAIGKQVEMSI